MGRAWLIVAATAAFAACAQRQPTLLEHIPQGAKAAVIVRQSAVAPVLQEWTGDPPEMKQELAAYLDQQLGVDLTALQGIAVFATSLNPPTAAALLRLPRGAGVFKGQPAGNHEGVDLFTFAGTPIMAARLSEGLLLGTPPGVRLGIDLAKKKTPALDKSGPLAALLEADQQEVEVLIGAVAELVPEPQLTAMASRYGLRSAVFTYDQKRRLTLALSGQPDKLGQAKDLITQTMQKGLKQLEEQKAKAVKEPAVAVGVGSIVGYHHAKKIMKQLEPKQVGDRLVASYQLPSGNMQMTVAVAGILAAVAIPAFIKYMRKSKTVEATEAIDKIAIGARSYFASDHYDKDGALIPKQFPPSSEGWVPAKSCCEQGGKCRPDPAAWAASPWPDLHFQLGDPHYFQYRFISRGTGKEASFIAEARGDLDCDGVFSSYRIMGSVDAELGVQVRGPAVENETE